MDKLHIGDRVSYWRQRRGKSQRTLAGLTGISQAYLSMIETGVRSVERRATLVALADALQVAVYELTGEPGDPTDPTRARAVASVPAIREALIMREVGETRPARGTVADLLDRGQAYDFAAATPMLPGLIGGATGVDLVLACHVAAFTLRYLGYPDLCHLAANLSVTAARELEQPAWIGIAEVTRVFSLPPEMSDVPARLARRTADEIQPLTGDSEVRQAYGMLHLHASLRHAVAGRVGDAMAHLDEAQEAADSVGEPPGLGLARLAFGPTNLGIWRLTIQRELGDTERAIADARTVVPERIPLATRQAPFYLDFAHTLASRRRDDEAIAAFLRAEAVAPQWVRLRPTARDMVATIYRRTPRRAVSKPLRRAAEIVGIRHR